MAKLSNLLRRAVAELAHLEKQLVRLDARAAGKRTEVAGKRAEVAKLEAAIALESPQTERGPRAPTGPAPAHPENGLPDRRTDAVVAVLRGEAAPMTPSQITDALRAGGRSDELRSVTATLSYLLKADLIERVGRGLYVAR